MGFFITLLIWSAVFMASELLRPKPSFEDARPAGLGDFRFPTATEGRVIPAIWGTVKIEAPNVVWYGNLRIQRVTESVKTGLFSSDDVTVGYRYFVGIQFALCRGPVDSVNAIWVDDKLASGGRVGSGPVTVATSLGGDRGSGELSGSGNFFVGNKTDAASTYLTTHQSPTPAYRGTCYYVFEDGEVGTSPNIGPWAFEITRNPDGLNLAVNSPGDEVVNGKDANPMNVLYEILTDPDWDIGVSPSEIDTAGFIAAASTLASEGNGWSFLLDREITTEDLIHEIERQIDGVLFFDRETGLWKIKLARNDYVPSSLPLLDDSNVIAVDDFARATWEETTNQVRVLFADADDNWKETYAVAQDMANVELQGTSVSADINFPGCKNRTLANKLAWRELATLSYPMAKATLLINREGFNLKPGDVFRWSNLALGISEAVYRISRFDFGKLDSGQIRVSVVEDIFSVGIAVYGDPSPTDWTGQSQAPVAPSSVDTLAFEAPRQMVVQDPFDPQLFPRIWAGARDPGGGTVAFQLYSRYGTVQPVTGAFNPETSIGSFLLAGQLNTDLVAYGSVDARPELGYNIIVDDATPDALAALETNDSETRVGNLRNILYVDGEFIGYEEIADQGGGIFHIKRLYRGLFHTAPKAHSAGVRIWFIGQSGGNLTRNSILDSEAAADLKLRSQSIDAIVSEASTPEEEVALERVHLFPLPPRDPELNNQYAPATEDIDQDYSTETGLGLPDGLGLEVRVIPRFWRKDDVLTDKVFGNEQTDWLADSPEFDFSLVLDPAGTPAETTAVTHVATDPVVVTDYILRNAVIEALGANRVIPSSAQVKVVARHTPQEGTTVYTNSTPMLFDFTLTSLLQGADQLVFGGLQVNVASATVVFGETGTYNFDIKTALPSSGILEASVNSGAFATVVAASSSTGTLAVTASDSVVLRFTQLPTADQFFDVTGPVSEKGYGVLLA